MRPPPLLVGLLLAFLPLFLPVLLVPPFDEPLGFVWAGVEMRFAAAR